MPKFGVYAGQLSTYVDSFVVRQANSVGASTLLTLRNSPKSVARAANIQVGLARRLGFKTGRGPIASRRLREASRGLDLIYTIFLNRGADLFGIVGGPSRPGLVVLAGGSDVTELPGLSRPHQKVLLEVARSADLVLCPSLFIQEKLHELLPSLETRLHYIGVEVPDWQPPPEDTSGRFKVVAVSRLHPVKGVDRSIAAFSKAFRGMPEVHMEILGDGEERQNLERLVEREGLQGRVRFLGRLDHDATIAALRTAQVMVQHSVPLPTGAEEALGLSLVEASAVGVPVVATRSGGIPEAVIDGSSGLLVEPGDVDSMADALRELYNSESLRRELGRNGFEFVRKTMNAHVQDSLLGAALLEVSRARAGR